MWNLSLRNFSAAGVLVLLVAAVASAWNTAEDGSTPTMLQTQMHQLARQVYRERVLALPEDAGVWHTTVVYPDKHPSDAPSRRLAAALASEERLRSLLAQTQTHVYAVSDPLWKQRLQPHYGVAAPAIIVQQPDGRVCFKASGASLPTDAGALADGIAQAVGQCRPRPSPAPTPSPAPSPVVPPTTIPDLGPATPVESDDGTAVLWMIAVPLLAGLAGLYQEWKQSNA